ncbi:MAG: hypothetical protein ACLFNZ_00865 [Spirochaetaceae bacterium]
MKRLFILLFLVLPGISLVYADGMSKEELGEVLKHLQGKTVSVDINVRIIGEEGESVWNAESRRLTVSGRSVTVTMEGDNIEIHAQIIPFINQDNTILLVAKGEVWIGSGTKEEKEYYSTMKSLPVKAGESIMFFPVGVAVDTDKNVYSIEMEIKVTPYTAG